MYIIYNCLYRIFHYKTCVSKYLQPRRHPGKFVGQLVLQIFRLIVTCSYCGSLVPYNCINIIIVIIIIVICSYCGSLVPYNCTSVGKYAIDHGRCMLADVDVLLLDHW